MINDNENPKPGHSPIKAKWFGLVNDTIIPVPGRRVNPDVLRTQGSVPPGETLFRDHGSPHDELISSDCEIDLALGNVFYSEPCGCRPNGNTCHEPPKLAFALDDRPAVTLRADQTGKSIRQLFGLAEGRNLLRDYESPQDQPIREEDSVYFGDGPVFITRSVTEFCINIEGKVHPWKEPTITVAQIRVLGSLPADQSVVVEDGEGQERTLREDEVVTLTECCRVGRAPKYKRG